MYEGTLQKYLMNLTIVLLTLYGFSVGKILHLENVIPTSNISVLWSFSATLFATTLYPNPEISSSKVGEKTQTAVARVSLAPRI